jgi:YidC/Oxa1 family membrane protein insertase
MDKNQATGLILLFGILFAYFTFFAPKPEQLPAAKKEAAKLAADTTKKASQEEIAYSGLRQAGLADSSIVIDTIPLILENEDIRVSISPLGGQVREVQLKKYKTWEGKPLILLSGKRSSQHFFVNASGKRLDLSILPFSGKVQKAGDSSVLELKSKLAGMSGLSQRFVLPAKGFELRQAVNAGIAGINPKAEMVFVQDAAQLEKDILQNRTTTNINYFEKEEGFTGLSETSLSEEKAEVSKPLAWFSFKQKFFNWGVIADGQFDGLSAIQKTNEADSHSVKRMETRLAITLGNGSASFRHYFGPNKFTILKKVAEDYDRNVYLGWPGINLVNRFITINVFSWLEGAISSYGIIIVILVLLIKTLLFPLSYKSYISMAKMKVLKPELDEIKERTGDDMQKAQAEQMKLYQQVGINPLSGCIPLLLQMPVLLAMFNFFPNAIELRQQSFWWAPDLSSYDSIATLPFSLPGYGDHVSLFTILMTASTLVLTWYNNQTSTVAGPMQSMSYIMPVVFMFILNSLPAGLSFYYLVSNVVSIVQQQAIKRFVDDGQLRKKLEENKVKNAGKKKTGFAARLEDAMRQAQDVQKEKDKNKKGKS